MIQQKAQCLCIPGLHTLLMLEQAFVIGCENTTLQLDAGILLGVSLISPRFLLSVMSRNVSNYLSVVVSRDGLIMDVFVLHDQRFAKGMQ